MTTRHQVSRAALELIKRFEGYRRKSARLADGRWTIGYGHTLTAREGAQVSEDDAEALLIYDVRPVAAAVNELTYTPLTQNQFDALVAFAFNVGIDEFRRSSVLRRINEGAMIQAACALEMWRRADFEGERIVVDALVRRRAAEKAMFLTPAGGWIPAPSPILRPRVDYDVGQAMPKDSTELETPMTGDVAQAHRIVPAELETPAVETSVSTAPESMAAAEAVFARLSELVAEPAAPEPAKPEPVSAPDHVAAAAPGTVVFAPIPDMPPSVAAPHPLLLVPPEPPFTPEPEPAEALLAQEPIVEPDASAAQAEPSEPEAAHDVRFDIPEQAEPAADLSRRVVWREAPMEPDAGRLLGSEGGLSPIVLGVVFLLGLAVFAAGIVLGFHTRGSGLISWVLGLVGILCVVSAVYIYLERLAGREE